MSVLVLCMSCLCLWLGKLSVLVSADYVVQVEMVSYSHPSNTVSEGQCCDSPWGFNGVVPCRGGERCDTYFIYCLLPHSSTATECSNNELTTRSNVIWNGGADIDFSQPTVFGLSNPFNLAGITTTWEAGAELYVEVFDSDGNPDDLIVQYQINPSPSVGSTITFSTSSSTMTAAITVNTTVLCAPFYSGSSCEIFSHCESSAVTCSERGTCTNGLDSYTCVCNTGYTGADCEVDIDECLLMESVCSGHGNCSHGIASFTCSCDPGYTGADCETDIDDCDAINCSRNGGCVDMVNMFLCDCEPGYTGADCETNIDDCVNRNCSGNGVCVDGVNSFSCESLRGAPGDLIGGTVGGLLVLMLILLLLIVVVVVCVRRRAQGKTIQDTHSQGDTISYIPGDDPVYGIPENRTNTITSKTEAEFDNPIYGSQESLNDAELINSIYGDADFEDVPYKLAPAVSDYETPSTCV
ncbi:neurogenic locus notch homolog protein 2-like isoform X2 [Halichondria panicea]|uniref:neurogenic locus notch homolog protein 2-like isoform X2 n=1 Tax=Halichondria panicea TaxID=6063 RepID=UPI00312BB6D3